MNTRAKQVALVAVGAAVALVMVFLGLWQMQVFVDKGNRTVQARAEQAPVPLLDFVAADGSVGDVYGKQVTVTGHYLPDELTIPDAPGRVRVLTALELGDGRVLPVVRGVASEGAVPPAPSGSVAQQGLFLPGEGDSDVAVAAGQIGSVRMPLLAQKWSTRQLVPGFITLTEADAAAQGLALASVTLPQGEGSFQNGGYALQWWIFAAFALGMSIKFAQAVGARERKAREAAALAELGPVLRKDDR